ncbi:MAG: HPr(Ser) kinase/phosphatase [Spirochaetes bacterium]|nr:HPr(Ser) kinase/phosphatase [Spirochaetota bacterium]
MKSKKLHINELLERRGKIDLQLSLIAGREGLNREIRVGDVNRPGLSLAGFFDYFGYERIQVFGLGETAYMSHLSEKKKAEVYEKFFSYDVVCCIFTNDTRPDDVFIRFADNRNIPTFVSKYPTTRFISLWTHAVEEVFSPSISIHGTLVDVFGVGVLLLGKSGVGKSECALELIEKGHRLVADDIVEIHMIDDLFLFGTNSEIITHHMEIRGLGIINVRDIYGIGSIRNRKRIELAIMLEEWVEQKEYDRLGIDEKKHTILDIDIPIITVPVRPGRNIPIIIETAALNHRLKKMGINSAKELDYKIQDWTRKEGKRNND